MVQSLKHTLAAKNDKKPTISSADLGKILGQKINFDSVEIFYPEYNTTIKYFASRKGKTFYPKNQVSPLIPLPEIGNPIFLEVIVLQNIFTDEFQLIRDWAREKGILDEGDIKTQFIKLHEEVGELAQSILKKNSNEFVDAIGDCVIVLTNLAALAGVKIENCINDSYKEISKRNGKMINNTFVKNANVQ